MNIPTRYNPGIIETKWQDYWERERIYSFDPKSDREVYSVDTPPPTVSGRMHLGHAFSYSQQDFVIRYQRMKGRNVFYPWGFDDNGLPTERYVERKCNIRARDMPRSKFIQLCLRETIDAERELKKSWQSLGISPDWSIYYRTIDEHCIRTSQMSFIDLYKKGREYRKECPSIWCPECCTAIAQVELEDRELSSVFSDIVFRLENEGEILIATTRPELLPACVAVFVHPEDKRHINLVGKNAVVPLFNYTVPILSDERVDPEKGSGIVMCCTFGDQVDMEWWKAHNLLLRIAITEDGKLNRFGGKYSGLSIKEARGKIIEDLRKNGLLRGQKPITHTVNVHERCGTEIEFLVTKQWFLRYLDMKEELLKAGRQIKWYPEHMRQRYENWIRGLQWDWCISRQRYFGVPFPVWYCKKCSEIIVAEESRLPVDPMEVKPKRACPKCGSSDFEPEKDVMDTWATSSLTPMIALRWKVDHEFFQGMYPMSLRPQAHDIITFWLFNTVVKGLLHENNIPWENAMISGWALDPKGRKMSKSKGNIIEPLEKIEKYSADCLRFWAASSKLGEDLPYQEKEFVAGQRFVTKIWNASRFVISHLKDYLPEQVDLQPIDRWIVSKLQRVIKTSTESFDSYEYSRVKSEMENFIWHVFCDEYLELVKDRLYNPDRYPNQALLSAKYALYTVLLDSLKLLAPIIPHVTEEIYHLYFAKTGGRKSIHISGWPLYNKELIDEESEQAGDLAVDIVSSVCKYKSSKGISLNTIVKRLIIECSPSDRKRIDILFQDIKAVTKVEDIEFGPGEIQARPDVKISILE